MEVSEPLRDTIGLLVSDPSRAGEARRIAAGLAEQVGFDEPGRGRVALVATELANNLIRHAGGGELVLSIVDDRGSATVEVLSLDKGPGMADFARCLADGYSSAGTTGNGLGAVARLADEFEAWTAPGQGSALLARLRAAPRSPDHPGGAIEWGALCLPVIGEQECGDAWLAVEDGSGRSVVMVADGLGHGPLAAVASAAAIGVLQGVAGRSPVEILMAAHDAARGTRGAAVAVAAIDRGRREVRFSGVGNIAATLLRPDARQGLVSHGGTVGVGQIKPQEFTLPWPDGSILVLHSDGLSSHWKLDRRSPLASKDPALIAGVLYRDAARERDDSTVVVARDGGRTPA